VEIKSAFAQVDNTLSLELQFAQTFMLHEEEILPLEVYTLT
jgi:hypothetical protein